VVYTNTNNDNYNAFTNVNNNDNVNVNKNKYDKSKMVELTALQLVDKLKNPGAYAFYCKVAYALPESRIWVHLESAQKGDSPQRLFTWLCKRDMGA
jgi:hypothetical protein